MLLVRFALRGHLYSSSPYSRRKLGLSTLATPKATTKVKRDARRKEAFIAMDAVLLTGQTPC
jgi:hypothetical protein